jgi:hypothetical protein
MQTLKQNVLPQGSSCIRFGKRTLLTLPVQLTVDGRTLGSGAISNASISGAFIETSVDLPLNTNLLVAVTAPGDGARIVRALNACVVRTDPTGLGVEWRDMASLDVVALLRLT